MILRRVAGAALSLVCAAGLGLLAVASSRAHLDAPPPTLMLQDRHGRFLGEVGADDDERLGFWPVVPVPERVVAATLAIEDRRFHDHPGVDPVAVVRAARQNVANGDRISGASTLAMQVARLQDPGPRTWPRKATEAVTALLLTDRYGRDAVLAQYLRLAPYGNNVHGVRYAARRYFDKPVDDLSWAETALLAGLPQAPGTMNLYRAAGRRRAVARAERILALLHADGTLDDVTFARAVDELAAIRIPARPERPDAALHAVLHLERDLAAARDRLATEPVVRTTLDLGVQRDVQQLLADAVREWEPRGAGNAAAVVVDRETFAVRAAVGSTSWHDPRFAGAIDYTRTPRTPGSTLKPFLYAAALDRGLIGPVTVLDDLRRARDGIGNADGDFLGPLLPRRALANSRNVPAVDLAERLGLDATYALYRQLGLHDAPVPADHYGLGLAIGGMPLTLVDLVAAWTALAGDGLRHDLVWTDRLAPGPPERIFTRPTAQLVTRWLADPMARVPSFPRRGYAELPFPAAIKTGTSPDFRDAWAVGFSEDHLVGVWVGHPDWTPMQQLSGYHAGARLLGAILRDLHAGAPLSDTGFPIPEGTTTVSVCALSGQRATDACDAVATEHVPPDAAPANDCPVHRRVAVDARTGSPAGPDTPPDAVRTRTVLHLPPRHATWARREGLPVAAPPDRAESVRVAIVSPRDGTRVLSDPDAPDGQGTLLLEAVVDPPVPQLVWTVDGREIAVVDPPYTLRWPLEPGAHVFRAHVPFRDAASGAVRVVAR